METVLAVHKLLHVGGATDFNRRIITDFSLEPHSAKKKICRKAQLMKCARGANTVSGPTLTLR